MFIPKATDTHKAQDRFLEFHLKKFNTDQINEYIKQYMSSSAQENNSSWESYQQKLDKIPGLFGLVATPFILSMVIQILPGMVEKYQSQEPHEQRKLLRTDIFDYFVDYWFNFQVERFQEQGKLQSLTGNLKEYLKTYSQNLASRALSQGKLEIAIEEQETLNKELLEPKDQTLLSQYQRDIKELTGEDMKFIRSGCLLKTGQTHFSFLHKSLI